MKPKVSVLIPTYRNPKKLKDCLNSLVNQTYASYEVIVMFDLEDFETGSMMSSVKKNFLMNIIQIPLKKMERMTEILNTGIEKATGDILAFLDEDIVVSSEWLSRIVDHFNNSQISACGGRDNIFVRGKRKNFLLTEEVGIIKWKGYIVGNQHRGSEKREVMFLKGCNMAVRKSQIGTLDENLIGLVRWEQDIFFSLLKTRMKTIYDPQIEVNHLKDNLSFLKPLWTYWFGHNTVYLFMKYLKGKERILATAFFFLIGDASSPGIFRFLPWILERNENGLCSFSTAQLGKIKGLLTYVRSGRKDKLKVKS